jgi:membrane protein implicated in regulation of membrane protease activity
MPRFLPWFLLLLALLLLPGPAGRLLLNLLGGLTLTVLLLPLLAGGAALIGWQVLKRRLRTCPSCGLASLGQAVCPACGTLIENDAGAVSQQGGSWSSDLPEIDARNVTINVEAVDVANPDGPMSADDGGTDTRRG